MRTTGRGAKRLGWAACAAGGAIAVGAALLQPLGAGAASGRTPAAPAVPATAGVGAVTPAVPPARTVTGQLLQAPATATTGREKRRALTASGSTAAAAAAPRDVPAFTTLGSSGLLLRAGAVSWAPDGSRFAAAYDARGVTRAATFHPDGRAGVDLSTEFGAGGSTWWRRHLAWSPRGGLLAVSTSATVFSWRCNATELRLSDAHQLFGRNVVLSGAEAAGAKVQSSSWVSSDRLVVSYSKGSIGECAASRLASLTAGRSSWVLRPLQVTLDEATVQPDLQSPVVSPDRTKIAFVSVDLAATADVPVALWVVGIGGGRATPLTRFTIPALERDYLAAPVWSPDGETVSLAQRQADAERRWTTTVAAYPVAGGAPVALGSAAGLLEVSRRPASAGPIPARRVTAAAAAQSVQASAGMWLTGRGRCDADHAQAAVLAPAGESATALVAQPLAAAKCGPVLLTGARALDAGVLRELKRLMPSGRGRTVYVVGTSAAFRPAVTQALTRNGFTVKRYGGRDVYATSVAVSQAMGHPKRSMLASARSLGDVLSASSTAVGFASVLLTNGSTMPKATLAYVRQQRIGAWAIGAQAQGAAPWATRVGGKDPVATSLTVAKTFWGAPYQAHLVPGAAPQLGLSAPAYAWWTGSPVLLTSGPTLSTALASYVDAASGSISSAVVFGNTRAVPPAVVSRLVVLAGGRPAG